MTTDQITQADLSRALASHVETLERAGITYDGRIGLQIGSRANGIAFRLYRTGYPVRDLDGSERLTTGHANPPVGSDYLGMTKREAYEALVTRTAVIADVSYALKNGGES
jgi:hypothetical protein